MKTVDKFLVAIVVGVVLVVAVAFVVVLRRPPPAFLDDGTSAGAAHNYLLALQQQDYSRAYGYLSPSLFSYPGSVEQFASNIRNNRYEFSLSDNSVGLEIGSSRRLGTGTEAEIVLVRETHFNSGPSIFASNQYSDSFEMELHRENGAWKIVASDRYFLRCWNDKAGC